jgi:hypothetical protein
MVKLFLFFAVQLSFIAVLWQYSKSRAMVPRTNRKIAMYSTLFFYVTLLVVVYLRHMQLRHQLDAFDLNKDGMFTNREICEAQKEALQKVSSNTQITFAPLSAVAYSVVYFLVLSLGLKGVRNRIMNK